MKNIFKQGSEAQEQYMLVNWLRINGYKFTMIANDTRTSSFNQKRKNKNLGMNAGMSDLIIILKRGNVLFLELKKAPGPNGGANGSVTSKAQLSWKEAINKCVGVQYEIVQGFTNSIKLIEKLENN